VVKVGCLVACYSFILRVTLLGGCASGKTGETKTHLSSPGTLFQRVIDARRDFDARAENE
jgi:hypothetical protein